MNKKFDSVKGLQFFIEILAHRFLTLILISKHCRLAALRLNFLIYTFLLTLVPNHSFASGHTMNMSVCHSVTHSVVQSAATLSWRMYIFM